MPLPVPLTGLPVDGDTSTNDTLVCMANGAAQAVIDNDESLGVFQAVLDEVCYELAKKIVKDGEGATKGCLHHDQRRTGPVGCL